jgi:hypothetical protein
VPLAKLTELDGREVDTNSEDWRHYCEARAVLAIRGRDARRRFLDGYYDHHTQRQHKGVLQHRGQEECDRLKRTMETIWKNRKINALKRQEA